MKYTLLLLSLLFLVGFQNDKPANAQPDALHAAVRTQLDSATGLFFGGNLDAALGVFEQTLKGFEKKLPPNDSLLGELYQWIGNVYYNREDADYYEAFEWYRRAIAVREQPGSGNPAELVRAYRAAALACNQLMSFSWAKTYLEKAVLTIKEKKIENPLYLANVENGLGEYHLLTGDPESAADHYENAVLLYKKCPPADPQVTRNLPVCLQNLGIACDRLGRSEKAIEYYRESGPAFGAVENPTGEAQSLHNTGMAYSALRNFPEALTFFENALKINVFHKDSVEQARNLAEIAQVFIANRNWAHAWMPASTSLALRKKVCLPGHPDLTEAYRLAGDCYRGKEQYAEALTFYDQAVENAHAGADDRETLLALGDRLQCLRHFPEKMYDALKTIEELEKCYLETRKRYTNNDARFRIAAMAQEHFETALEITASRFEEEASDELVDEALRFAERNKSMALVEDLQALRAAELTGAPIAEERDFIAAIYRIKAKMDAAKTEAERLAAREKLSREQFNYNAFLARMQSENKAYFELKYKMSSPLTTAEIRERLADNQMFVEFFEGNSSIFIITVSEEQATIRRCDRTAETDRLIRVFQEGTSGENAIPGEEFPYAAHRLYEVLLEPALLDPKQTQPVKSLRIVPDGQLCYLSFEALMTDSATVSTADKAPYLLKKMAVSYLPANVLLENPDQKSSIADISFGGFGIEYKKGPAHYRLPADTTPVPQPAAALRNKLGVLEYADEEVIAGQELLGGKIWLNEQVTVEQFRKKSPSCDILHLALHGAVDEDIPLNSALVFEPHPDSTTGLSHLLRAADIYGLNLHARLVVLSACNTGTGQYRRGEGVQSLARAFAAAGCKSEVMTLWSIPDQSTATIMRLFFEQLKSGKTKDEALREAKLAFITQAPTTQHLQPNFWAAAVVCGDAGALEPGSNLGYWWGVVGCAALIASIFILKQRRRG